MPNRQTNFGVKLIQILSFVNINFSSYYLLLHLTDDIANADQALEKMVKKAKDEGVDVDSVLKKFKNRL